MGNYTSVSTDIEMTPDNSSRARNRSALYKKTQYDRRLLILAIILIIALIIGLIVLGCNYASVKKELNNKVPVCQSEHCIRTAANLKLSMDFDTDPCDDFYKFTCGRWTNEHSVPNRDSYSNMEIVDEKIKKVVADFFERDPSPDEPLPLKHTRIMHQACLGVAAMDKLGYEPIFRYLSQMGLPPVPHFFNLTNPVKNFKFDWIKASAALKTNLDIEMIIGFSVSTYNRSMNIITLSRPSMSSVLPNPTNHDTPTRKNWKKKADNDDDDSDEEDEEYKEFMRNAMKILINHNRTVLPDGIDDSIEEAVDIIMAFLKKVSDLEVGYTTEGGEEWVTFNVKHLQNLTDQSFLSMKMRPRQIWETFIRRIYEDVPEVELDLKEDLIMTEPDTVGFLSKIAATVDSEPDLFVELSMWWMAVNSMVLSTTKKMRYLFKHRRETAYQRGVYCSDIVNEFMGKFLSYNIADRTFLKESKPRLQKMLDNMKTAFVNQVNSVQWMDSDTKASSLEKIKLMSSYIGFSERLIDKKFLDTLFSEVTFENTTHLDNMIELARFETAMNLLSLRTGSNAHWNDNPSNVNAFYFVLDNSINIPLGILYFPFYHLGIEALNYGSIGTIVGHELTHGFDNTGRKYDKYGNYRHWWTDSTINKFDNLTHCFVKQYGNYNVPQIQQYVNGRKTLPENIADNGGLHQAYSAYKNFQQHHPPEPILPGFENYTHDQMFFIAFSSTWCEKMDDDSLVEQLQDEHPPSDIRVLGTLTNSEEFAEAFKCPLGSRMNPKRPKCKIW